MDLYEVFSNNIKQRRLYLGLTQRDLGELMGYSEKSISKWESGKTIVPSALLPRLSEILKMSIDDMFSSNSEASYFLGIDGGGTKTEFLLVNRQGEEIKRLILGPSNPVDIGFEKAFETLEHGITEVCEGIPFGKISVFAGIAGGTTGGNKKKINTFLKRFRFQNADNDSDAMNTASLLSGDNQISVILGTGDIAFTKTGGKVLRTGGFGYLFDEGGSGYSIGRDALLEEFKREQYSLPETILSKKLKSHCKIDSFYKALGDFYEGGKRKIASVAPAVFLAFNEGDKTAKTIIEKNLKAVAELIIDASRFFNEEEVEVMISGSIGTEKGVIEIIDGYLKDLKPKVNYQIKSSTTPPVMGALKLAGFKGGEAL